MTILLLIFSFSLQPDGWGLLSTVEIVKGYDSFMGTEIECPKFSNELNDVNGDFITLKGFMIPLEEQRGQDYFVLSRFPFQSCFFCGMAGPETVVEVYMEKKTTFTEKRISVTGKLKLNKGNPLHLFFILEDSKIEVIN